MQEDFVGEASISILGEGTFGVVTKRSWNNGEILVPVAVKRHKVSHPKPEPPSTSYISPNHLSDLLLAFHMCLGPESL